MLVEGRKRFNFADIEQKTIQLLNYFDVEYFKFVRATPLLDIVKFLSKKHNIIFDFGSTLGFSEQGERILGAFNPRKRVILVDSSLTEDRKKFNFTLAHELGHLALHRNVILRQGSEGVESSLPETIHEFIYGNKSLKTEMDWLEWQANTYASCLMMPKEIFTAALIIKQRELGISRVGEIFIDEQTCNVSDFHNIVKGLSEFFVISKSAIEYRLYKTNLVNDCRKESKSLRNLLADIL